MYIKYNDDTQVFRAYNNEDELEATFRQDKETQYFVLPSIQNTFVYFRHLSLLLDYLEGDAQVAELVHERIRSAYTPTEITTNLVLYKMIRSNPISVISADHPTLYLKENTLDEVIELIEKQPKLINFHYVNEAGDCCVIGAITKVRINGGEVEWEKAIKNEDLNFNVRVHHLVKGEEITMPFTVDSMKALQRQNDAFGDKRRGPHYFCAECLAKTEGIEDTDVARKVYMLNYIKHHTTQVTDS